MRIKFTYYLLSLLTFTAYSQKYEYNSSIGRFNQASSFHINSAGFIYITDRGTNQVIKMDTLGNRLKENGGFGWSEAAFDDPRGIFATTLNVYVCDRNNHRIQFFDKDLNFLSQLRTRESDNQEIQFGYPTSVAINKQGDMFVLDPENKRVIKFDLFGNFIQNFGGYNYGRYSLQDPLKLSTGPSNNIFVAEKNRIVIYDQYGNGIGNLEMNSGITDINIVFDKLSVISENSIFISGINKGEFRLNEVTLDRPEENGTILSSIFYNNKLYILTPKQIDVFTVIQE